MIIKPKGTKDIFGSDALHWQEVENKLRDISAIFNFSQVETPIFESKNLFVTTVGEGTDVVNKELYEFNDKGNREMALRPEGTAGVVRSFIENKMYAQNDICKLFYIGPMFRYERPQNGRQRQFNQYGVEIFSTTENHNLDFEAVSAAKKIIDDFNLKSIKLVINNLGDTLSRVNYVKALVKHFEDHGLDNLCETCNDRIHSNPLRILDCKACNGKDIVQKAPIISNYITKESNEYFTNICNLLKLNNIEFEIDPTLVRGLGYYSGFVFEFINTDENQGAKSTIIGGGHYSDLVKTLGGPDIVGVGFALGIERLMIALELSGYNFKEKEIDAMIINISDNNTIAAKICNDLRMAGLKADISFKKIKNAFKDVENNNAKNAIIIGNQELKNSSVVIKNQKDGNESVVLLTDIVSKIKGDV